MIVLTDMSVGVTVMGRPARGEVRRLWFVHVMVPSAPEEMHPTAKEVNLSPLGERREMRRTTRAMEMRMPNVEQPEQRPRARIRRLGARAAQLTSRYAGRVFRWLVAGTFLMAAVIGLLFITRGTAVRRVGCPRWLRESLGSNAVNTTTRRPGWRRGTTECVACA